MRMLMTCKDSPGTHFGVTMALAEALISMQSGLEVILRGFQQSNKSFEQIMSSLGPRPDDLENHQLSVRIYILANSF